MVRAVVDSCTQGRGTAGWGGLTGLKYLVMVPCLEGGCDGGGGGGGSGGGGGWLLGLTAKILWNVGLGLMEMFLLTHSLTPVLNFDNLVSVLRHSSSLL